MLSNIFSFPIIELVVVDSSNVGSAMLSVDRDRNWKSWQSWLCEENSNRLLTDWNQLKLVEPDYPTQLF